MHAILPLTLPQSRGEERTFDLHGSQALRSDFSDARQDAAEATEVEQG